jgi:hypothetical protein
LIEGLASELGADNAIQLISGEISDEDWQKALIPAKIVKELDEAN